jgi:hypothetical protein
MQAIVKPQMVLLVGLLIISLPVAIAPLKFFGWLGRAHVVLSAKTAVAMRLLAVVCIVGSLSRLFYLYNS